MESVYFCICSEYNVVIYVLLNILPLYVFDTFRKFKNQQWMRELGQRQKLEK